MIPIVTTIFTNINSAPFRFLILRTILIINISYNAITVKQDLQEFAFCSIL